MEENKPNFSDDSEILRFVSMSFNVSESYSEFKMRLDIMGLGEGEAVAALKRAPWFDSFLKYISAEEFSFEFAFKKRNDSNFSKFPPFNTRLVLPYFLGKTVNKYTFTPELTMTAIGVGGKEFKQSSNGELAEDMEAMHGVDLKDEMFAIMMQEIGMQMCPETGPSIIFSKEKKK